MTRLRGAPMAKEGELYERDLQARGRRSARGGEERRPVGVVVWEPGDPARAVANAAPRRIRGSVLIWTEAAVSLSRRAVVFSLRESRSMSGSSSAHGR